MFCVKNQNKFFKIRVLNNWIRSRIRCESFANARRNVTLCRYWISLKKYIIMSKIIYRIPRLLVVRIMIGGYVSYGYNVCARHRVMSRVEAHTNNNSDKRTAVTVERWTSAEDNNGPRSITMLKWKLQRRLRVFFL